MKNQISEFLQSRIEAGDFPSAVYLVAEKGEIVLQDALGFAVVEPERIEARIDTIYDLASLTKPLVTGLLCAKLIEKETLDLTKNICFNMREFCYWDEKKADISLQNLLTHTSGFHAWEPFYITTILNQTRLKNLIAKTPLKNLINSEVIYSDVNFIVLGILLRRTIKGSSLNEIANKMIFEPLNLQNTFFNPPKELQKRIAASEFGNYYEKKTCHELGYFNTFYDWRDYKLSQEAGIDVMNYKFRDYQIWGEVHDGNCYFMNGVSGHAGLFSTAEETFKIAQQFLANQTTLLQPETCELFRTNFTPNLNEARSIAFQLAETPDSTASKALAKDSFGHLGFTGTSLWIEPETERIFILLTNRTHAHKLPFVNINSVRRRFHELAQEYLNSK